MTNGEQIAGSLIEYTHQTLRIKTQSEIITIPAKDLVLIDFTQALEKLVSGKAYLHVMKGKQLSELGMDDEAREEFKAAMRESPRYAEAYFELGTLLEKRGQTRQALEYFSRAMAIDPDKPGMEKYFMDVADSYFSNGKFEAAADIYYRLFLKSPENPAAENAVYRAGFIFAEELKNNKKALPILEEAVAKFPDSQHVEKAIYEIGRIHEEEGALKAAENVLLQLISKFPSGQWDDDAHYVLCKVYHREGRNEDTMEEFAKVMSSSTDAALTAAAQKILEECMWNVYHVSDGLPSDNIRALTRDGQYIWIGTTAGIAQFDLKARLFTGEVLLKGTDVSALAADDSHLWAGTADSGLKRYSKMEKIWDSYTKNEGLSSDKVFAISVDPNSVWVGTDRGVCRYNKQDGNWTDYTTRDGLTGDSVISIASTSSGVWCGALKNGLNLFDNDSWQGVANSQMSGNGSVTSISAGGAYVWFAWYEELKNGASRYNALTKSWDDWVITEWEEHTRIARDSSSDIINLGSSDQETWVGADAGVLVYDHNTSSWSSNPINYPAELAGRMPVCVLVEDGSVWFATSKGLGRLDKKLAERIEQFRKGH